jgi:hypothetical protein
MASTGMIVGQEPSATATTRLRLERALSQIADRAQGQVELAGNLRRGGPESDQPSNGQPQREFGGAWHRSQLPNPQTSRIRGPYQRAEPHETFLSGFRTKLRVA